MADVPHSSPAQSAKGGVNLLKSMPKSAWVVIGGLLILIVLYMRRQQALAAAAASTQNAAASGGQATTDAAAQDQSTTDSYMAGYESAMAGAQGAGYLPGAYQAGSNGGSPVTINFPTGGGAPNTPDSHGAITQQQWNDIFNAGWTRGYQWEQKYKSPVQKTYPTGANAPAPGTLMWGGNPPKKTV